VRIRLALLIPRPTSACELKVPTGKCGSAAGYSHYCERAGHRPAHSRPNSSSLPETLRGKSGRLAGEFVGRCSSERARQWQCATPLAFDPAPADR
jgi:hypothetical protein